MSSSFCEYMGSGGGVCLQPPHINTSTRPQTQVSDHGGSEFTLQYCAMHRAIVDHEHTQRKRHVQLLQANSERRLARHLHRTQRSRSEPYLTHPRTTAASSSCRQSQYQVPPLSTDRLRSGSDNHSSQSQSQSHPPWARAASAPAGLFGLHAAVVPAAPSSSTTTIGINTPLPKKRVRVRKIVVPPRFEMLDGSPTAAPQVWYVRLGEDQRPAAEDDEETHEDEEYIEVDDTNGTGSTVFGIHGAQAHNTFVLL